MGKLTTELCFRLKGEREGWFVQSVAENAGSTVLSHSPADAYLFSMEPSIGHA